MGKLVFDLVKSHLELAKVCINNFGVNFRVTVIVFREGPTPS